MGVELEVFDVRVSPSRASAAAPYPRVVRVERTSPAERAGIEAGDVIVKINGVDMRGRDPGDFITKPGAALDLHVDSEGRSREVHVELAPPPAWEWGRTGFPPACQMGLNPSDVFMLLHHDSLAASALNIPAIRGRVEPSARSLAFRTLSTDSSGQRLSGAGGSAVFSGTTVFAAQPMTLTFFGAAFRSASLSFLQKEGARNGGVPVMFVTHNSAAARAGLEAGDIVLRVGRQPVKSMTDLQSAMQKMAGAEPVELEVLRNQKLEKVSIKLQ
jgi:S1-C subfamily serine protease